MKVYISGNRVLLFLLCSLYTYIFISISELPWSVYVLSLILCAGLLAFYLLFNLDILLMRKYRLINLVVLIYSLLALYSVYINGMFAAHQLMGFVLNNTILSFIEIQREKGHFYFLCKVMFFWLSLLLFMNDVLMVIMPGRFYGDGLSRTFLLGNKFQTGYDHILWLFLVCILLRERKRARRWLPVLFAAVCAISHYMDCNTAISGTIVFFLVSYFPGRIRNFLNRKSTVAVAVILTAMFIRSGDFFRIGPVKYFVTDFLGRDVTLTGREQIYEIVPKVLRARPWLGYGSSAEVIRRYTGAFNAQNGFFDMAICYGIPCALIFVLLLIMLIRKAETRTGRYALGAIYGFLIMSTVELTLGSMIILFGIILYTDSTEYVEDQITVIDWGG